MKWDMHDPMVHLSSPQDAKTPLRETDSMSLARHNLSGIPSSGEDIRSLISPGGFWQCQGESQGG
jgi:hypothetical protein